MRKCCYHLIRSELCFVCDDCVLKSSSILCIGCVQPHLGHRIRILADVEGYCDCGYGCFKVECHSGFLDIQEQKIDGPATKETAEFISARQLELSQSFADFFSVHRFRLLGSVHFAAVLGRAQFGQRFMAILREMILDPKVTRSKLQAIIPFSQPLNCCQAVDNQFYYEVLQAIYALALRINATNMPAQAAAIQAYFDACNGFAWYHENRVERRVMLLVHRILAQLDTCVALYNNIIFSASLCRNVKQISLLKYSFFAMLRYIMGSKLEQQAQIDTENAITDPLAFRVLPLEFMYTHSGANTLEIFRNYQFFLISLDLRREDYQHILNLHHFFESNHVIDEVLQYAIYRDTATYQNADLSLLQSVIGQYYKENGKLLTLEQPFYKDYEQFASGLHLSPDGISYCFQHLCAQKQPQLDYRQQLVCRLAKVKHSQAQQLLLSGAQTTSDESCSTCSVCREGCSEKCFRFILLESNYVSNLTKCRYYFGICPHFGHLSCLQQSPCEICKKRRYFVAELGNQVSNQHQFSKLYNNVKASFARVLRNTQLLHGSLGVQLDYFGASRAPPLEFAVPQASALAQVLSCGQCMQELHIERYLQLPLQCLFCLEYFHFDCLHRSHKLYLCPHCGSELFASVYHSCVLSVQNKQFRTARFGFQGGGGPSELSKRADEGSFLRAIFNVLNARYDKNRLRSAAQPDSDSDL